MIAGTGPDVHGVAFGWARLPTRGPAPPLLFPALAARAAHHRIVGKPGLSTPRLPPAASTAQCPADAVRAPGRVSVASMRSYIDGHLSGALSGEVPATWMA